MPPVPGFQGYCTSGISWTLTAEEGEFMSKWRNARLLCAAAAAAVSTAGSAAMAAEVVNLDATALPAGPLSSWANTGTLGGNFSSGGTGTPQVASVNGVNAVQFNNVEGGGDATEFFVSPF